MGIPNILAMCDHLKFLSPLWTKRVEIANFSHVIFSDILTIMTYKSVIYGFTCRSDETLHYFLSRRTLKTKYRIWVLSPRFKVHIQDFVFF